MIQPVKTWRLSCFWSPIKDKFANWISFMTPSTTFSTATKNSTLSIEWLIKETFPRANNGCNIEENFVRVMCFFEWKADSLIRRPSCGIRRIKHIFIYLSKENKVKATCLWQACSKRAALYSLPPLERNMFKNADFWPNMKFSHLS